MSRDGSLVFFFQHVNTFFDMSSDTPTAIFYSSMVWQIDVVSSIVMSRYVHIRIL